MGLFGINTGKDYVHFGTRSDVCSFCLLEKAKAERTSMTAASNALRGELEGKKIVKFNVTGTQATICMYHLHKLSDANREESNHD